VLGETYRGVPVPAHLRPAWRDGADAWRDGVDAALEHVAPLLAQEPPAGQPRALPDACASCGSPYRRYRSIGRFCHHTSECTWDGRHLP